MQNGSFPKTAKGEYLLSVGNKIVYTSKDYQNPKISQIVEIKSLSGDELAVAIREIEIEEKVGAVYER